MALVACPECGRDVSSESVACPDCGFPLHPSQEFPVPAGGEPIRPRPAARVARPPLRYPTALGAGLMVGGSIGVILGSFMPWVRLGPVSISGMEGDGAITLVIGGLMLILAFAARTSPSRLPRWLVMAGALAAVTVAMIDTNRLVEGGLSRHLIGGGLAMIFIAGVVALIGTFLRGRER